MDNQILTLNNSLLLNNSNALQLSGYYDMSGPMSWLGKELELLDDKVYYSEFTLDKTNFHGWSPSTTAFVCIPTTTAKTFIAYDLDKYEYILVWDCYIELSYQSGTTNKAKPLFATNEVITYITRRPSSILNIQSSNFNGNAQSSIALNMLKYYGTTAGTVTYSYSANYGFYFAANSLSFSSTTINSPTVTIKTPLLYARCNNSYMTVDNAELIDEVNSFGYMKGRLYRIKRDGFFRGIYNNTVRILNGCVGFSSLSPFTLSVNSKGWNGTIEYSNGNSDWITWNGDEISGTELYLRGTNNTVISGGNRWIISGSNVKVFGNLDSLLDYKTATFTNHPTMNNSCCKAMFNNCNALSDASMLRLPRLTLVEDCYYSMFTGCKSLTLPPVLPATTLAANCYREMFFNCTNLEAAPALPATIMVESCYRSMLNSCPKLKISTTQATGYDYTFRIPADGTGTNYSGALLYMFNNNDSPVISPAINTTYYATFPSIS